MLRKLLLAFLLLALAPSLAKADRPYQPAYGGGLGTSGAIAIGTTSITGGTNGYILYDNSGVLGNEATQAISGDISITSGGVATVTGLNGTSLSGLATGLLQNTTGTGVPSIAAAATLATSLTTPLLIGGTGTGSTLTYKTTTGVGATDAHIFQVGNNGATEAMRILSSGNVGIGTTTAGSMLTVGTTGQATIASTGNISTSGTLAAGTTTITSTSATSLAVGPNGATTPILQVDSSTASAVLGLDIVGQVNNGDLALNVIGATNGNIALSPIGNGSVKIKANYTDTSIPTTLPVANIRNVSNTANNSEAINFINSNVSGVGGQIQVVNGTQTASNSGTMIFSTWNAGTGVPAMRITSTQAVGIGTATIRNSATLDIHGGLNVDGAGVYLTGVSTGTNADFLCLATGGEVLIQSSACTISKRELKENFLDVSGATAVVDLMALKPTQFNMKAKNIDPNGAATQYGFIAEDVASVDKHLAIYENDMLTPKSYRQEAIIALLVKGFQTQQEELAAEHGAFPFHKCSWPFGHFVCAD